MKQLVGITLLFFLSSCSDYSVNDLRKWITDKDNGLVQEVENDNFKIEVQYKPQNYLVAFENKEKEVIDIEFKEQVEKKEGLQFFNIKLISKTGKPVLKTDLGTEAEEDLRLKYYIGAFEYDIFLADGKDTLPCVLYHFERTYGALPFNNISVAFENKNKNKENKILLIADRALGFNIAKFTFNKEDINKVPHLKTK